MSAARLKVETEYLREFVKSYFSEIAFAPEVEREMRDQGIYLSEVNNALRTGIVVHSEKEDANGVTWIVEGETCDDEHLRMSMEVFVDRYHLCIKGIVKLARS